MLLQCIGLRLQYTAGLRSMADIKILAHMGELNGVMQSAGARMFDCNVG